MAEGSKYQDIAAVLEAEIRALPDGGRVPGELEIADRFGVARSTARAALQQLASRNVVRRVRGAGSFAVRRIDYPIDADRAPSWSATVRAAGGEPRSVVLSCVARPAPPDVAAKLDLDGTEPCHRLVRRSYVNDHPAAYGVEWVPITVVPELAAAMRATDSLHRALVDIARTRPERAWVRASAETLDPDVADQLDISASGLGWYIESLNIDGETGRPLCLTQRWIRSDTIRVVFESAVRPSRETA